MLSMTIANRVSLVLVATFAVVAPLTGMDWATYGWHFAAAGLALSVTFAMFAIGGMGGGDAKLIAASSLWMGFNFNLLGYLVISSVIGGVLTLLILMYRKSPLADVTGHKHVPAPFRRSQKRHPYGLALGTWRALRLSGFAARSVGDRATFHTLDSTHCDIDGRCAASGRRVALAAALRPIGSIFINLKLITIVRIALTVI